MIRFCRKTFKLFPWVGFFFFFLISPAWAEIGPYLQIGPAGMIHFSGASRNFDPGPGFQLSFGYDWEKFGWRSRLLMTSHDDTVPFGGVDQGVESFIFTFDMKLYLLAFAGKPESPFQPYLLGGVGTYILTEGSSEFENDSAAGAGGNLGIGFDWRIMESISLGIENDYHFIGFIEESTDNFGINYGNGFALYFSSLVGTITFHF